MIMIKYEYRSFNVSIYYDVSLDKINALATDGWKLVFIHKPYGSSENQLIFERPIKEKSIHEKLGVDDNIPYTKVTFPEGTVPVKGE
jgi:hypothetical protein